MPKSIDGAAAPDKSADENAQSLMAAVAGRVGMKPPVVEKQKPDKPETPEDPEQPETPDEPEESEPPEEPETPEAPEEPEQPETPETPDEPEQPDTDPAAKALAKETAQLVATKLKDLPAEIRQRVQGVIDARIGKIAPFGAE